MICNVTVEVEIDPAELGIPVEALMRAADYMAHDDECTYETIRACSCGMLRAGTALRAYVKKVTE
ncbi:MAG: hypothetical protein M0Z46_10670 [Actinomycetota bacterium]|nr:hypothetical protein [Actinomycetota bacterium]